MELSLVGLFLCIRHSAKHFSYIISFNCHNNSMRQVLILDSGVEIQRGLLICPHLHS